jgi:hypothetical protein
MACCRKTEQSTTSVVINEYDCILLQQMDRFLNLAMKSLSIGSSTPGVSLWYRDLRARARAVSWLTFQNDAVYLECRCPCILCVAQQW